VSAGSVRERRFAEVWGASPVFKRLRTPHAFLGKCGECRYLAICGGCRARAYSETGDYLDAEPFCTYEPSLDSL
jgi:radical SAM protein with 4Fe4S-binding SPASM domain